MESLQQTSERPRGNLPPSEVDCRWWKKGNCTRGSTCFFRHDPTQAGVDNPEERAKVAMNSKKAGESGKKGGTESSGSGVQITKQQCSICFEEPEKYGLLINCDHVFCLECIRSWRTSAKNTTQNGPAYQMSEDSNTLKKTSKTCPMCRVQSDYVVPSNVFPDPPSTNSSSTQPTTAAGPESSTSGEKQPAKNSAKEEIVNTYLSRLKKIPCRYFEESVQRKRDGIANAKLSCGFGNNCHYAHINPDTHEPYVFSPEEITAMKAGQARKRRRARDMQAHRNMAMLVGGLSSLTFADDDSEFDDDEFGLPEFARDGPDFEALSDFFGPSPFAYNMINRGFGPVFPADMEWETETETERVDLGDLDADDDAAYEDDDF